MRVRTNERQCPSLNVCLWWEAVLQVLGPTIAIWADLLLELSFGYGPAAQLVERVGVDTRPRVEQFDRLEEAQAERRQPVFDGR